MRLRLALLTLTLCFSTASAFAQAPIDDYAYDKATDCRKKPTPGALALVDWLAERNARGTFWGTTRCERWGKNSASRCTRRAARSTGISTPPARRTAARRAA